MQSNIKTKEIYIEPYDSKLFVKQWIPETANRTAEYAKAPIVLLHDSLGCVGLWKDFPESLARETGRAVYAYDRLGYGRSSASNKTPRWAIAPVVQWRSTLQRKMMPARAL